MDPDGRVVRRDQGGDTVSEGQAYAMLLAAAIGDRARFDRVWGWTRAHLAARRRAAVAWRRRATDARPPPTPTSTPRGRCSSPRGASTGPRSPRRRAASPAPSVLRRPRASAAGACSSPGPGRATGPIVNPSYIAPRTFALLGQRDLRASRAARSSRALQAHRSGLAPDWARATPGGATPTGKPDDPGGQAVFSYDAVRIPIRLAEDCAPSVRREAARPRASLQQTLAPVRDLGGQPLAPGEHAVFAVAAAAATAAAGDRERAAALLDRAAQADAAHPSYYGAAWVALGRVMLTTRWLRGCPPM